MKSEQNKVISKNNKGTKTYKSKKSNMFSKFLNILKNHWKIVLSVFLVIVIVLVFVLSFNKDKKVLTINGNDYYTSDFMIYLFSSKYNYFNGTTPSEDDLNVIYDEETNTTVRDYLKESALNDLKTSEAIKKMADDNNIALNNQDLEELKQEKKKYISSIGGKKEFYRLLKENNTNEDAYDKMSESDKLYKKILTVRYGEGKINDLTEEEKLIANISYNDYYIKIEQIILTIVDINSGKSLNDVTINQKEALANDIVAKSLTTDFEELIKKYSEDAVDKEEPYYIYYKKGELLPELEKKVLELNIGEVSEPIKTKYAYHIIKKLELDNDKLKDYYDELREDKCLDDLKEYYKSLKIVYHDAYKKINIE